MTNELKCLRIKDVSIGTNSHHIIFESTLKFLIDLLFCGKELEKEFLF